MDELMKDRVMRRLDGLPDEKVHQVLDYIEFLESKFSGASGPSTLEKIADKVENTMRAGRVSVSAIKGTREVFDAAGRVVQGIADAGRTVIDELQAPTRSDSTETTTEDEEKSGDDDEKDDEGDADGA